MHSGALSIDASSTAGNVDSNAYGAPVEQGLRGPVYPPSPASRATSLAVEVDVEQPATIPAMTKRARTTRSQRETAGKLIGGCGAYDDRFVKRDEGVRLSWQGKDPSFDSPDGIEIEDELIADEGRLIHGDNRAGLASLLPELRGKVALAYLDPPFLTNRAFEAIEKKTGAPRSGPLKSRPKKFAFDDRWASKAEYL